MAIVFLSKMENLINVVVTLCNYDNKNEQKLTIIKVIGEGKTSTVYLVHPEDNENELYALKIQSEQSKNMHLVETANKTKCIPHIYTFGKVGNYHGTLMEYMDKSKPLTKLMYRNTKMLSTNTIIRIGLLMMDNLIDLHANGLEYPDLSLANIACLLNNNSINIRLYDFDALRIPSNKYTDHVGKQHESFYSCFEKQHTYIDDICSLIFIMITLLGGTFWNYKHIMAIAEENSDNSFFTRLLQLSETKEPYNSTKYDSSPFKTEYRRLINKIKKNVYNHIIEQIESLLNLNIKDNHEMIEELIRNNFILIHNHLCTHFLSFKYNKYRTIIGLYLLAVYLTEYSYSAPPGLVNKNIYDFICNKFKYLSCSKMNSFDNTMLFYDYKVNLMSINYQMSFFVE